MVGAIDVTDQGAGFNLRTIAELPLVHPQLDGAATDVCGNLYVIRTDGLLFRVFPETGDYEELIRITGDGAWPRPP